MASNLMRQDAEIEGEAGAESRLMFWRKRDCSERFVGNDVQHRLKPLTKAFSSCRADRRRSLPLPGQGQLRL